MPPTVVLHFLTRAKYRTSLPFLGVCSRFLEVALRLALHFSLLSGVRAFVQVGVTILNARSAEIAFLTFFGERFASSRGDRRVSTAFSKACSAGSAFLPSFPRAFQSSRGD